MSLRHNPAVRAALVGLVFGAVAVHLSVVGVLLMLHHRWIVVDTLSLGQAILVGIAIGAGAMATARVKTNGGVIGHLGIGVIAGAACGVPVAVLTVATVLLPLQPIFISLSPDLVDMLTLGLDLAVGMPLMIAGAALAGLLGAALRLAPPALTRPLLPGAVTVLVAGVFQELIQLMLQQWPVLTDFQELFYTWDGLGVQGAVMLFVIASGLSVLFRAAQRRMVVRRGAPDPKRTRLMWAGISLAVLIVMPALAGSYIGQVLMLVGLYILMGMGLNLEVGLAGLLDLGFVAFFAVGAYTTAILTADSPHALAHLAYWEAMPVAVFLSVCVGVLFGLPVLGVRGDYLAVATLGLGEIVRVLVMSDFAAPLLGGAQGILQIPKPRIGDFVLNTPVSLFYLTLVCSAVAAFVAWRLENSRLGRAWMALRDDEDVAQALGINLVRSKLLAYGLGAAFAGLAGSIFGAMLTSVYPTSFQLLISINVLALIIVGGMGSLPGVVLGSIALIGLPELLREFGEYRYLFYGAVLVVMMRLRPEGLWPSETRRRELHSRDETIALDAGTDAVPAQGD
ncbi:MAG TPA: branched-chain amino acid ABC transporter permease [Acetobacteraceae bacterium]|nr:branched-chain amino acid ABC transporter permease [Acetobacteraceae bacterium]